MMKFVFKPCARISGTYIIKVQRDFPFPKSVALFFNCIAPTFKKLRVSGNIAQGRCNFSAVSTCNSETGKSVTDQDFIVRVNDNRVNEKGKSITEFFCSAFFIFKNCQNRVPDAITFFKNLVTGVCII